MKHFVPFILCLIVSSQSTSQSLQAVESLKIQRQKATRAITVTPQGYIALVHVKVFAKGKEKELVFKMLDVNGNEIGRNEFRIEGIKEAKSLIHTHDGGFVVAGSGNKNKKDTDGVIIKLNEKGELLWQAFSNNPLDDQFNDLIQMEDGSIAAISSSKNNQRFYHRFDLFSGRELLSKPYKLGNYTALAMCIAPNNTIALTGYESYNKKNRIIFRQIADHGKQLKKVAIFTSGQGNFIFFDPVRQYFVLAGKSYEFYEPDGFALILDSSGKKVSDRSFGTAEQADEFLHTSRLKNGEYLFAGYSTEKGFLNKYFIKTNDQLDLLEEQAIKNTKDEYFHYIFNGQDGQTVLAGRSGEDLSLEEIPANTSTTKEKLAQISIDEISWLEGEENDTLKAFERSYLKIKGFLRSEHPNFLQADIKSISLPWGTYTYDMIYIGLVPAMDSFHFFLPLVGSPNMLAGELRLEIIIRDEAKSVSVSRTFETVTESAPLPKLNFGSVFFTAGQDTLKTGKRGIPITLNVYLVNEGEAPAKDINTFIELPADVIKIKGKQDLVSILPGDSTRIQYQFKINSYYLYDSLRVRCRARDGRGYSSVIQDFVLEIPSFFSIPRGDGGGDFLIPSWVPLWKIRHGGYDISEDIFLAPKSPKVTFLSPKESDPDEGLEPEVHRNRIGVKIRIESDVPLELDDIQFLDREEQQAQSHYPDFLPKLVRIDTLDNSAPYIYLYQNALRLVTGNNVFKLMIKGIKAKKRLFKPFYKPYHYRIHTVFVGVDHKNAPNTVPSARQLFEKYEILMDSKPSYLDVKNTLLVDKSKTTKTMIKALIRDFKNQYDEQEDGFKDVLLIYFATHGVIPESLSEQKRLKITCSGYQDDVTEFDEYALDLEYHVLNELMPFPIEKFLILDICNAPIAKNIKERLERNYRKGNSFKSVNIVVSNMLGPAYFDAKNPTTPTRLAKNLISALKITNLFEIDKDYDGFIAFHELEAFVMGKFKEENKIQNNQSEQIQIPGFFPGFFKPLNPAPIYVIPRE